MQVGTSVKVYFDSYKINLNNNVELCNGMFNTLMQITRTVIPKKQNKIIIFNKNIQDKFTMYPIIIILIGKFLTKKISTII